MERASHPQGEVPAGGWYNLVVLYSHAPRCRPCGMPASLDRAGADTLVHMSRGRLESYQCPVGGGWHLRRMAH